MFSRQSAAVRYALVLILVVLATGLSLILEPVLVDNRFVPFWAIVGLAAWLAGIRAGLLALIGVLLASNYLFVSPRGPIYLDATNLLRLGVIALFAVWVGALANRYRAGERRSRYLRDLTAALSSAGTAEAVADAIIQHGIAALGCQVGSICVLSNDGSQFEMLNRYGLPDEIYRQFRTFPLDTPGPLVEAIHLKTPIWIGTREEYERRYPMFTETVRRNGTQSSACLPLIVHDRAIGGISLSFPKPRAFSADERVFLTSLAYYCAQALDRARLYDAERQARGLAEQANAIKLTFLAMISHELRTPLASIKGFTSTLLATDVQWSAEQEQEFIQIIDQEADRLTELVLQLLDVSSLEAGTLRISPAPVSVESIVESAMPQLMAVSEAHPLNLDVAPDLAPIQADGQRVRQVLVNLVDNAGKYSPPGKPITVRARQQDGGVAISVSDEGNGIPPEQRGAVFEAFRQIARDSHQRGAGLGLAICKGVIEAHGGKIWIEDRPVPGTTFTFWLPLAAP